jgi:hypothetical protein
MATGMTCSTVQAGAPTVSRSPNAWSGVAVGNGTHCGGFLASRLSETGLSV